MYAALTRIKTLDEPIANATIVSEEMERWLNQIDGFQGMLVLSRPGETLGLTFWRDREIADRHRKSRMEFLGRMAAIAGVEVQETDDYEITYASIGDHLQRFPRTD
jgi:hypothetical protein